MKQRLVSAAIGILLLIILLFFYNTWIFNLVIGLLAALGIHELMLAAKYTQRKLLTALSLTIGMSSWDWEALGFPMQAPISPADFLANIRWRLASVRKRRLKGSSADF